MSFSVGAALKKVAVSLLTDKKILKATNNHTWGEWTVSKEATETEDGEETRECSVCKKKDTRVIPKKVAEQQ